MGECTGNTRQGASHLSASEEEEEEEGEGRSSMAEDRRRVKVVELLE